MSSSEQRPEGQTSNDDIAPPDPTAGQPGDGPTQTGAPAGEEGEGADKSTQR